MGIYRNSRVLVGVIAEFGLATGDSVPADHPGVDGITIYKATEVHRGERRVLPTEVGGAGPELNY